MAILITSAGRERRKSASVRGACISPRQATSADCLLILFRCLRHYAIYELQWPHRTSAQAASMPTPRESTPAEQAPRPNTHNLLHAVGKKLAATAASTSAPPPVTKRKRQESSPLSKHKRRKTLSSIPLPAAHPRELIRKGWSRSGRKHLPSVKAREIEPIQAQKRPRGRPRRHPIPTSSTQSTSSTSNSGSPPSPVSAPPALRSDSLSPTRTAKSRAVDDQPRDGNGRFGKKESTNGRFRRRFGPTPVPHRTRAQRAEERAAAQREADGSSTPGYGAATAVKRERSYEYEHTHDIDTHWPGEYAKRPRVSSGSGYAYTQSFTPNPMSFARKKWAPAQPPPPPTHHLRSLGVLAYPDPDLPNARQSSSLSSSAPVMSSQLSPLPPPPLLAESESFDDEADGGESDDGDLPVTPENVPDPEPDADARPELEDNELPVSGSSTKYVPTLWKPSPFAFAARRWASQDGGSHQSEHDRERGQFFRASRRDEQPLSTPRRGSAARWSPGIATNVSAGVSDASRTSGDGARGVSAGGGIARTEWVQMNGTAEELSMWDPYGYGDSASASEEEVC